jgi:hypothetical protein
MGKREAEKVVLCSPDCGHLASCFMADYKSISVLTLQLSQETGNNKLQRLHFFLDADKLIMLYCI